MSMHSGLLGELYRTCSVDGVTGMQGGRPLGVGGQFGKRRGKWWGKVLLPRWFQKVVVGDVGDVSKVLGVKHCAPTRRRLTVG